MLTKQTPLGIYEKAPGGRLAERLLLANTAD